MPKRKSLASSVKTAVLHEAGYRCANPICRTIITLDIHHLVRVCEEGGDTEDNLLALCPNCHSLYHKGHILIESLRTWKMLLLSFNQGFDRKSVDLLLALDKQKVFWVSGDGVLEFASLLASDYITVESLTDYENITDINIFRIPNVLTLQKALLHKVSLTQKGEMFINAWKEGNQEKALSLLPIAEQEDS